MATYKIDASHSDVTFKVKHLMISSVTGHFNTYDSTLEVEGEDLTTAKITFEANVDSIDTKNEQRDGHLKSDDFFNAEQFPKLTFSSTSISKTSDSEFTVTGDLTIRDVTKSIELTAEYNGQTKDPWGMDIMGFEISGKINRIDFGLKWGALTEAGGKVLGEDVKLSINAEFIKQA